MPMTLAVAETISRAAINHAARHGLSICVAVCDGQGRLTTFSKMDGTSALAGHEAIRRAMTAAGTGQPSDEAAHQRNRLQATSNEGLGSSFRPGGLPLLVGEDPFGGVGVCGGTAAEDVDCARAGAAALDA